MRQIEPTSRYGFTGGSGNAIFGLCLGVFATLICLFNIFVDLRTQQAQPLNGYAVDGVGNDVIGGFIWLFISCLVIWGTIHYIVKARRFGRAVATVPDFPVPPGSEFQVQFELPCRQRIEVQLVGIFLVLRERVTYGSGDSWEWREVDRLIQGCQQGQRIYSAGESITIKPLFRIPSTLMGIRHPYQSKDKVNVETSWRVKVRIDCGERDDIWKEFEVEVEVASQWQRTDLQPFEELFDVHLCASVFPTRSHIIRVMEELLPHLDSEQFVEHYLSRPCLLRENVQRREARMLKEQLEAADAVVEIRPRQV